MAGAAGVCLAPNQAGRGTPWLRSSRNSGAAIAGRVCYTTAVSAASLGHLGAAHKRGSGAKTARSREEFRPDRTNSFWISAESARAPFRRRKSADASITAFIPLSVRVNGAGRSTGC